MSLEVVPGILEKRHPFCAVHCVSECTLYLTCIEDDTCGVILTCGLCGGTHILNHNTKSIFEEAHCLKNKIVMCVLYASESMIIEFNVLDFRFVLPCT